jgi:hypothetical protein
MNVLRSHIIFREVLLQVFQQVSSSDSDIVWRNQLLASWRPSNQPSQFTMEIASFFRVRSCRHALFGVNGLSSHAISATPATASNLLNAKRAFSGLSWNIKRTEENCICLIFLYWPASLTLWRNTVLYYHTVHISSLRVIVNCLVEYLSGFKA